MARGITQNDVDEAADALLLAGERPTVERIRQHLGTGSPNTVTRLLEAWWKALGPRLAAQQRKIELPTAPESVAELASQFWQKALESARVEAESVLAGERDALAAARLECDARVAAAGQAADAAQASEAQAAAALAAALERMDERQQLISQQVGQIEDLGRQRDQALAQAHAAATDAEALRSDLARVRSEAEASRDAQAEHLQAVENRAHAEVDRARQELRDLKGQLQAADRAHRTRLQQLESELAQARATLAAMSRDLAAETARRETLGQQLEVLRSSLKDALAPAARVRVVRSRRKVEPEPSAAVPRARSKRSK